MRIKICGITNQEDAQLCSRLGADALGFVFYDKSERNIDPVSAENIIAGLSPFIMKIGVFVDKSPEEINFISKQAGLNAVQVYENASQYFIDKIVPPVIKCFRIKKEFDFSLIDKYKNCSFLLDTYVHNIHGGTGETFEWNKIPDLVRPNIILAGGISEKNIEYVFKEIKPAGVDLSSSIELFPGKKSEEKLKRFFGLFNNLRGKYE